MIKEFGYNEIKLKDYKPKYQLLELMLNRVGEYMSSEELYKMATEIKPIFYEDAVKKYGDLYVLSVEDYDMTKTTSIILRKFEVSK